MKFDSHLVPVIIVVFLMLAAVTIFFVYNPVHEGFEPLTNESLRKFLATDPNALAIIANQREGVSKGCLAVSNFQVVGGPSAAAPECQPFGASYVPLVQRHLPLMTGALQTRYGAVPPNIQPAMAIAVTSPSWPPADVVAPPKSAFSPEAYRQFLTTDPDAVAYVTYYKNDFVKPGCMVLNNGRPEVRMSAQCAPAFQAFGSSPILRAFTEKMASKFGNPSAQEVEPILFDVLFGQTAPTPAPMPASVPSAMPVPPQTPGAPTGMATSPTVGVPSSGVSVAGTSMATATPMSGSPAPFAPESKNAPATVVIPENTPPGTYVLRPVN